MVRNLGLSTFDRSLVGDDLKAHLAMLPEKKRKEHIHSFEKLRETSLNYCWYLILEADVFRMARAERTRQDGPWHLYLKRKLGDLGSSSRIKRLERDTEIFSMDVEVEEICILRFEFGL